jgi:hypothetical protein
MRYLKLKKAIFSVSKLILISAIEMAKSAKKDSCHRKEMLKLKLEAIFRREIMNSRKIVLYSVVHQKVKNLRKSKRILNKLRSSFKAILQ